MVIILVIALIIIFLGVMIYTKEKYYDEDIDDYREKEEVSMTTPENKRVYNEEEYYDEDIDDYQEKI